MNDQKITDLRRAALDTAAIGAKPSIKDARRGIQEALQAFQTSEGR